MSPRQPTDPPIAHRVQRVVMAVVLFGVFLALVFVIGMKAPVVAQVVESAITSVQHTWTSWNWKPL